MQGTVFKIRYGKTSYQITDWSDWLDLSSYLSTIEYRKDTKFVESFCLGSLGSTREPVGTTEQLLLEGFIAKDLLSKFSSILRDMQILRIEFEWYPSDGSVVFGYVYGQHLHISLSTVGIRWSLELIGSNFQRKSLERKKIPDLTIPLVATYGRRIQRENF